MANTFFYADPHFFHANIIRYCNRPFSDVDTMDGQLVFRYNEKVKDGDTVFFLGDFSLGNREATIDLAKELHGNKILIKGNHDHLSNTVYSECGFTEIYKYPIVVNGFYILSHQPMFANQQCPYFNIYGHVHDNPNFADISRCGCCVSVERTNYEPISMDEIRQRYAKEFPDEVPSEQFAPEKQ